MADDERTDKETAHSSPVCKIFKPNEMIEATCNYSKLNILGEGGQATVYKGTLYGTQVAIKKYKSTEYLDDMKREIEALQQVKHRNIIALIGCCPEQNCIVSEFMEGGSLQDKLKSETGEMLWADRYRVAQEMVSAVFFLHSSDVLHRDLKPLNILFDRHGTVKVADMGLAKMSAATISTAHEGGTAGYIDTQSKYLSMTSRTVDVYALGLIILQLCTHKPSVCQIHEILSVKSRTETVQPTNLLKSHMVAMDSSLPSEKAELLLDIGLKCAQYEPEHRPSLLEVVEALQSETPLPAVYRTLPASAAVETRDFGTQTSPSRLDEIHDLLYRSSKGDADAQFAMGHSYLTGYKVEKSREEAVRWYDRAVRQGHAEAADALETIFANAYASSAPRFWFFESKELTFIKACASKGVSVAQFFLGKCHSSGRGVEKSQVEAAEWYMKAAEQGYVAAQCSIADCFFHGWGVDADKIKAAKWYAKAAEQGDKMAQLKLAECRTD